MTDMDFVEKSVKEYQEKRPVYERYAKAIEVILVASIEGNESKGQSYKFYNIKSRAKSLDGFKKKVEKHDDKGEPKYKNPMEGITDLAGVRVIVYFPRTVSLIEACIGKEFKITERSDVGKERMEQGIFGYQSVHYLVSIKEDRNNLPEYIKFTNLVGEIQVRTILQHAWAEMEHDIIYKSSEDAPTSIKRRFIALAGMLEIADNEFQIIQDDDENIRGSIKTSLYDDLTEKAQAEKIFQETTETIHDGRNPGEARDLVAKKEYDAAITLYSQMIEVEPRMHTHYIGRAKAKFLSGDRSSALDDIAVAENLCPNDKSILSIKQQIEEGNFIIKNPMAEAWKLTNLGNKELSKGDGEKALEYYLSAKQSGYYLPYAIFNQAMASVLKKDYQDVYVLLSNINVLGSMMEINVLALRAIITAIGNNPNINTRILMLENRLNEIQDFSLSDSPLRHLHKGFKNHPELLPLVERIFSILNGKE